MCKIEEFKQKEDKMVNKHHNHYITYSGTGLCAREFNGLIIVTNSERKSQKCRSYVCCNKTCCSVNSAAVFENIHTQT